MARQTKQDETYLPGFAWAVRKVFRESIRTSSYREGDLFRSTVAADERGKMRAGERTAQVLKAGAGGKDAPITIQIIESDYSRKAVETTMHRLTCFLWSGNDKRLE